MSDAELQAKGLSDRGAADFIALISQYQGLFELTAAVVNALIDKITVSERKKNADDVAEQRITIYYKFVGSLHEYTIPVPKRVCHREQKPCSRCGAMYQPGSNVALYCPDCREAKRKENDTRQAERRRIARGSTGIIPKPCQCCGATFMPKSINSQFCEPCAPEARIAAEKEWRKMDYQRKKAKATVGSR